MKMNSSDLRINKSTTDFKFKSQPFKSGEAEYIPSSSGKTILLTDTVEYAKKEKSNWHETGNYIDLYA